MKVLVTGAAGFIGYHVAEALLARGDEVAGVDDLNDYYDVRLKEARLARLRGREGFRFDRLDIADRAAMERLFANAEFERVVHLAAQPGVRYSITNPHAYVRSNLDGFANVLEGCRQASVRHCVFASSSSVYGASRTMPLRTSQNADHPLSLYAATKRANELMAHAYAHLYRLPMTGLRFFTVYGPWGRPDMSPILFTKRLFSGEAIDVFNYGRHQRDFTYVADVVEGVVRALDRNPAPDPAWSGDDPASSAAPFRVYNLGNNQPVELLHFIACLERLTGRQAKLNLLPLQAGDVLATYADIEPATDALGFRPSTPLEEGLARFVDWYRSYYGA